MRKFARSVAEVGWGKWEVGRQMGLGADGVRKDALME
jgi:hypothetical protein